jgi:uncharacterized phage-associated protein
MRYTRTLFSKERRLTMASSYSAPYNVIDVAEYIISLSEPKTDWKVGNLKLQKLLYYVQGFYAAINNEVFFNSRIVWYTFGPVIPEVWDEYKRNGYNDLLPKRRGFQISDEDKRFIEFVWKVIGNKAGAQLEAKTKEEATYFQWNILCEINPFDLSNYFNEYYIVKQRPTKNQAY